ncbi:14-3-3 domain-containing protein [Diaporthe sp. PMI_573]|nr:14-3-3 domain-containing protein [Diaporthaceae sp. PMI_573]KAH8761648.1 14-3-3 domain-containing protein [Diaporthaceae sp. PMI_573]
MFPSIICKVFDNMANEMASIMKDYAKRGGQLGPDERELLSVVYKNAAKAQDISWRIIHSIEQKEAPKNVPIIREYRHRIELEIEKARQEVLDVLDNSLIPQAASSEAKVFYHKLKADYHRYLAEFVIGEKRNTATTAAHEAYKNATDVAQAELTPAHPTRLALALNYSVFYHQILGCPDRAYRLTKQALDDAELCSLGEKSYGDSNLVIKLLRDNLTLWTSSINGEDEAAGAKEKQD